MAVRAGGFYPRNTQSIFADWGVYSAKRPLLGGIMLALIVGAAAAIVGILVGFWLRGAAAKAEQSAAKNELAQAKQELAQARTELDKRAGFEALAAEREKSIGRLNADCAQLREDLKDKTEQTSLATNRIAELNKELEAERKSMAEKIALLDTAEKTLSDKFQALAADILEKKSKSFSEGSQRELGTLLDPLKTQIKEFREKVEQAQTENLVGRTQLSGELKQLTDLNQRLSNEAHALTTALTRDTSEQGHWGELVLLDILEACDLKRGLHYTYQQTFNAGEDDGIREDRRRTDVILRFPEGRQLIIDSKVTLTAHKDYIAASDDLMRKDALERLVGSIRNHIRELAAKNYQQLLGEKSPDYVVLFAPNEAAYLLAVQADKKLITDGYKSKVLIAGPTTILHIARIVESLWRNEGRAKSLQQIGERARLLYEEFTRFVDALENVRTAIRKAAAEIHNAEESNNEAIRRLTSGRGNLVSQAEKLGQLANKSSKQIASRILEMAEDEVEAADAEEQDLALSGDADGAL